MIIILSPQKAESKYIIKYEKTASIIDYRWTELNIENRRLKKSVLSTSISIIPKPDRL